MANWENIHEDFTEELQKRWEKKEFEYEEVKKWIDAGLTVNDVQFAIYLKKKVINIEHLNKNNIEVLKKRWLENQYEKLCEPCQIGNCEKFLNCANPWTCICVCGVNSFCDITEKIGIILGGGASTVGGFALPVQFPTPVTVLLGGAMVSTGINSVVCGAEKAFNQERIDWTDYSKDIAFSAAAGALTGGIQVGGEYMIAKKAIGSFARKLGVRVGAGVLGGVAAKGCDEFRHYCEGEEEQMWDINSWITSLLMGGVCGAVSHGNDYLSRQVGQKVVNSSNWSCHQRKVGSLSKVLVESVASGIIDFGSQEANVWSGKQKEIDWSQIRRTVGVTAGMATIREVAKNKFYEKRGGRDQFLDDKKIENEVQGKDIQKEIKEWRSVINNDIENWVDKTEDSKEYRAELLQKKEEITSKEKLLNSSKIENDKLVEKIKFNIDNKEITSSLGKEKSVVDKHKRNLFNEIKTKWEELTDWVRKNNPSRQEGYYNENVSNAHALTKEGKGGQIAVDVGSDMTENGGRKTERSIYEINKNKKMVNFVGYIDNHDYSKIPKVGETPQYHFPEEYLSNTVMVQRGKRKMSKKTKLISQEAKKKWEELKNLSDDLNIDENLLSKLHKVRKQHWTSQKKNDREKIDEAWNEVLSVEAEIISEKGIDEKRLDEIYNLYVEVMKFEQKQEEEFKAFVEAPSRSFIMIT